MIGTIRGGHHFWLARAKIVDGDAHHAIIIPKGFDSLDSNGKLIDLKMMRDPGRQMAFWAMDGLQSVLWSSLSIADGKIIKAVFIQWGWAVVLMSLAIYFFRRNYVPR